VYISGRVLVAAFARAGILARACPRQWAFVPAGAVLSESRRGSDECGVLINLVYVLTIRLALVPMGG
jgi:hypothetical protein